VFCPKEASKIAARKSSEEIGFAIFGCDRPQCLISDAGLPPGLVLGCKVSPWRWNKTFRAHVTLTDFCRVRQTLHPTLTRRQSCMGYQDIGDGRIRNREPDSSSFCVQQSGASLGQNTGGASLPARPTHKSEDVPDLHMSKQGPPCLPSRASIIDQADPDSIPMRIQFKPTAHPYGGPPTVSKAFLTLLKFIRSVHKSRVNTNWAPICSSM